MALTTPSVISSTTDARDEMLDELAERTHEYCRLAIVEGENLIWVARAQGAKSGLRYDPDMGQELVLHATANGKASARHTRTPSFRSIEGTKLSIRPVLGLRTEKNF